MATFYNQATLSFNGRLTNSNVTEGELLEAISVTKTVISSTYGAGGGVVYALNILNSGTTAASGLTVVDDLGAYTFGATTVYPLSYVDGSVRYFVNGQLETAPAAVAGPPLTFTGINIPAGANVSILYEATATEFAPLAEGSVITNTATVSGTGIEPVSDTAEISAAENTLLSIAKAICPAVVTDNGELTYTFVIQNMGNTAAVATDDVILADNFNPILSNISVTYNGSAWTEGTNYSYSETTGEFTSLPGQITVPAATYTQDPETGAITVTPGVTVITVTGTV